MISSPSTIKIRRPIFDTFDLHYTTFNHRGNNAEVKNRERRKRKTEEEDHNGEVEEEKKGKSIRVEPVIAENLATVSSSLSIIDSSPIRLSPTPHARVLTVGSRFRNSIRHRISSPIQQSVPFQSYAQEQIVKRPPSWLIAIRWRVRKRFRNMFLILRATLNLRSRWWRVDFVLR